MRRSTTERGLGSSHQKARRRLLPDAYGRPCPLCGLLMLPGQPLDLDHVVPPGCSAVAPAPYGRLMPRATVRRVR
jgi:hypothetical protein